MPLPSTAYDDGPPEWVVEMLADREWLKAQHRACIALLAHLAETRAVPAQDGLVTYIQGLMTAFEDREEELQVPNIRSGRRNALELRAVQRAQEVYFAEAGSKYLKDIAKG